MRKLTLIMEAIEEAGYQPGQDMALALDCAASERADKNRYVLEAGKLGSARRKR